MQINTFIFIFNIIIEQNDIKYSVNNIYYVYLFSFYIFILIKLILFFSLFWIYFSIYIDHNLNIRFSLTTFNLDNLLPNHYDIISCMHYILIINSLVVSISYLLFYTINLYGYIIY